MPRGPELLEYNETGKKGDWRTWAWVDFGTSTKNRFRAVEFLLDLREEGYKKAAVKLGGKRLQPSKEEMEEVLEWRKTVRPTPVADVGTDKEAVLSAMSLRFLSGSSKKVKIAPSPATGMSGSLKQRLRTSGFVGGEEIPVEGENNTGNRSRAGI